MSADLPSPESSAGARGSANAEAEPRTACNGSSGLVGAGGVRPYYDAEGVTLYHGDAREILPMLGDVGDVLITDPPYSSGGYQEAGKSGGSVGTRSNETVAMDNLSTRGYQRLMREVLRGCRACDEMYVFTDWRMWIHTSDALEDGGWRVRNMLVWDKKTMGMGLPWRNQHELIAYAKRTAAKMMDGKRGNVLTVQRSGNKMHPTEKPLDLAMALIENSGPGVILDVFAGSGTTLVAAKMLGRRAIGIELEEAHCKTAVSRLSQSVMSFAGGGGAEHGERNGAQRSGPSSPNGQAEPHAGLGGPS
jgi:DNA modification methylase